MPKLNLAILAATLIIALSAAQAQEQVTLTVAYTTDLHGVILNGMDERSKDHPGCLARAATLIRQWRIDDPDLILIDNGDTIQGNPLMYHAARQMPRSEMNPLIAAMNIMGYDAMAIGNHEFNFGNDYLRHLASQASFPFLSANTINKLNGEPEYQPYVVIERKGVRIGILGLVTSSVPSWELPRHIENLKFLNPAEAAEKYVPILREQEQCDVVIVSLHDGLLPDPDAYSGYSESAGVRISKIQGVDLLLTGHVHRLVEPTVVNDTHAATGPPHARGLISYKISLTDSRIDTISGEYVEITDDIAIDPEIETAAISSYDATGRYLDTVIAENDRLIIDAASRYADSPMVDLLHKAQLEATGADISLASLLPWGGYELPPGPVTIRDIFRFYPYENTLVTIELRGSGIREALEWSARYFDGIELSDGRLILLRDAVISPYNMDHAEGISYRIDPTAPEGNRVKEVMFRGAPLDDDRAYTVALNSYRYAGGGGYTMLSRGKLVAQNEKGVREILIDYITEHGMLGAWPTGNWHIGPEYKVVRQKGTEQ